MTKDLEEKLAELCKEKGMRLTGPRRTILRVLSASPDHPDAEELHRRVMAVEPGINIATVYRTMNTLAEHGLIERHSFADGRARYEAGGSEHHDHFVNVETDEVVEFRCDEIEILQQKIAREHGFEIVGHRLEIYVRPLSGKAGI
ncbi:transcriptional repressor [Sinirhodobacter populi]|uniref:Ferric uptake regulation protein n=2 Tax=Paenirhodobacter populi TaxID=2306993 RepID=A0A443JGN0_9RHOB|nr:Fur family transcriptional regulator [Sinirhodobacter populi]RWR19604.1 transcriptional repressor [Sinirhodobacter populi]